MKLLVIKMFKQKFKMIIILNKLILSIRSKMSQI